MAAKWQSAIDCRDYEKGPSERLLTVYHLLLVADRERGDISSGQYVGSVFGYLLKLYDLRSKGCVCLCVCECCVSGEGDNFAVSSVLLHVLRVCSSHLALFGASWLTCVYRPTYCNIYSYWSQIASEAIKSVLIREAFFLVPVNSCSPK